MALKLFSLFALAATVAARGRGFPGKGKGGRPGPGGKDGEAMPKKSLKDRLEKFDRLVEMAAKGQAEIPGLKDRVEDLKQREASLMEREEVLETPKMPVLEHNPFSHDPKEMDDDMMESMAEGMGGEDEEEDDPKHLTPQEQAARKKHMEKAKNRLEKMRNMNTDERLAYLKAEREKNPSSEDGLQGLLGEDFDPLGGRLGKKNKPWKTRSGNDGPPVPKDAKKEARKEAMLKLTKEERHMHIREHQKTMQDHRENMENWRETHATYMDERRDIMDEYRSISHEIREAIFANRDL